MLGVMANDNSKSPAIAGVVEEIRNAHSRWCADCLALEMRLSDAGLSFGATGYKLAVERGALRLAEGVTLALDYVSRTIPRRSPAWPLAHHAILEAVDQQFMACSLLIPAPASDPALAVAVGVVGEQVDRHCEQAPGRGWLQRLVAAFGSRDLANRHRHWSDRSRISH